MLTVYVVQIHREGDEPHVLGVFAFHPRARKAVRTHHETFCARFDPPIEPPELVWKCFGAGDEQFEVATLDAPLEVRRYSITPWRLGIYDPNA